MDFDLDKVLAEGRPKTTVKPFTFTFGGEKYTLPLEVDVLAIAAINDGGQRANEGLRKLLGPEQYDQLLQSPVVMTNDALRALFDAYAVHMTGVDMGESAASTRSSRSTARPSKQTSKRATKSTSRSSARKS